MLRNIRKGNKVSVSVSSSSRRGPGAPGNQTNIPYEQLLKKGTSYGKIRRMFEQRAKDGPRNANNWIAYMKFESTGNGSRLKGVCQRAIAECGSLDVYLQAMRNDPSYAMKGLKKFPNSWHMRKTALDIISPSEAVEEMVKWVDDDPSWLEMIIELELKQSNYARVSVLYKSWSVYFDTDIEKWERAAKFELQHGTNEGYLDICASAIRALFLINPQPKPRGRMGFYLDFLDNCGWSKEDCKEFCGQIKNCQISALEESILCREEFRYAFEIRGISEEDIKRQWGNSRDKSLTRRTANLDPDVRYYAFERAICSEPPERATEEYKLWAFTCVDYCELRNSLEVYQRVLKLCRYSTILISSYVRFLQANYSRPTAEEYIVDVLYTHNENFPTDILMDLDLIRSNPEPYRPAMYTRLANYATSAKCWHACIAYETYCKNYDAVRGLYELALSQIKSFAKSDGGLEDLWQSYVDFEHKYGNHKSYLNILRRWFRSQHSRSPKLWDEIVEYWYRRHGKLGAKNAIYAASQLTGGDARKDHIKRGPVLKRKYGVK